MVYPRRLLNDHETVVVDLHPHWWFFAGPVSLLLTAVVLAVLVLVNTDPQTSTRTAAGWGCLGLIALASLWLVVRSIRWLTTSFVITTQRVISRSGVLSKHGVEVPLERVNTVVSSQSLLERIVVAGDLMIESGGERGQEMFTDIRNPERIKQVLHGLVHESRDRVRGLAPAIDVAAQLERFEGMLQRGTLTPEEFEMQKQRLLDQL